MKKLLLVLFFLPLFALGQDGPFYFMSDDTQREYYLHIPNDLPPNSPIVYVLHGWGGSGASIMSTTGFNALSDQNDFAVCYPTGLIGSSGMSEWDAYGVSDIDFINSLNESLQIEYQLDQNRVFATGFSYGAEMSYHLASCQTTNIFAAIAPVSGGMWDYDANGWTASCTPTVNISVFVLNGTNDNEFDYNGGYYPGVGVYLSVDSTIAYWTNYSSCTLNSNYTLADVNIDDNLTEVTKYYNTTTGDRVWLYKVNNGAHEWFNTSPSGNHDFSATEEIWNFFTEVYENETSINELNTSLNKKLLKTVNVLGQEIQKQSNTLTFYIFDDGTVEKKIIID